MPPAINKQMQDAIARLPQQASDAIKRVLANAQRQQLVPLIEACESELKVRGALDLTAEAAAQAVEIGARVAGKPLGEVITIAFAELPPKPEELLILRWIAQHPGTSYQELSGIHKGRDLALVIGHLVYHRFGYFRPLLVGETQSDLLLQRDKSGKSVRYTLRPEAASAFDGMGLFADATQARQEP